MVKSQPPSPLRTVDYEAIQDAVMETERGRWFLREYAQRNRSADTEVLLSAIEKLHNNLVGKTEIPEAHRITLDLADMANAIAETKKQISAMGPENGDEDKIAIASTELDAIVNSAEKATGDILNAAEQIQEIAWNMREKDIDNDSSDNLDRYATDIYTACSFQDLTGQRTEKVINVLQFIENRVIAMMDIWKIEGEEKEHSIEAFGGIDHRTDAHLLNGPQLEHNASSQNDIDDMMSDDMFDTHKEEMASSVVEEPEVFEQLPKIKNSLSEPDQKAAPEIVNNPLRDVPMELVEIEFDVSGPEIIDCVAVGCETPYDSNCVYLEGKSEENFLDAETPNNAEPYANLDSCNPDSETSSDDEQIEIGTSDEFAMSASSKLDSNPDPLEPMDNVEKPDDIDKSELALQSEPEQGAKKLLDAPLINTADPEQSDPQEFSLETFQGPEPEVAAIELTAAAEQTEAELEPGDGDLNLSSLSQDQRQAIFS